MLDYGKKTYIMGILNVTPDSFSDGGDYTNIDIAVNHAKEMIELGADMIDLGGESTRPGHKFVSAEEEISRIVPVIKRLKEEINVPICRYSRVSFAGDQNIIYSSDPSPLHAYSPAKSGSRFGRTGNSVSATSVSVTLS